MCNHDETRRNAFPAAKMQKKFFLNNGGLPPYHTGNLTSNQGGNSRLLVILKVRKMFLKKGGQELKVN